MSKGVRNVSIDMIKGMAIIFVVLGHCGFPWTDYLYLFHMAVFLMASGYCFSARHGQSLDSFWNYVLKKIRSLWLPYFAFNSLFWLLHNTFIRLNIITDNPAFSSPKSKIGIFEVIGHISDAFHFEPYATHQLCGADWFVIVLFYVTIAFCLVYWISNQLCNSERIKNSILLLSGVAALYVGNILKQREIFLDGYLSPAITCYAIYVIGYFLKKAGTIEAWIEKYSFVVIILGAVALSFLNRTGSVSLGSNYFTTVPHVLLSSVVGWYWLMAIAKSISKKNGKMIRVISYALSYIGTRSIWILFLHFLSFKPVNALLVLLYNEPAYMIASFPTYNAGGCWWIIFSICGICLPLLAQRAVAVLAGKVCKKVSEIEKVKL